MTAEFPSGNCAACSFSVHIIFRRGTEPTWAVRGHGIQTANVH
jgi:hypothetical protein